MTDLEILARDKYEGNASKVTQEDKTRLAGGEPLAYVIGWVPFLGLHIDLSSKPLIPRPETEWWTEVLITHLTERFGIKPFRFLDLCAGSGAIGLAVLKTFPNAEVFFSELYPEHCEQIRKNIELNKLDASRADVRASYLFGAFSEGSKPLMRFDCIATNPPYIPSDRELDASVLSFEPHEALFAGTHGLDLIKKIAERGERYLYSGGEIWMECDISNIEAAKDLLNRYGADQSTVLPDLYGRPRVVVSYFP